MKTLAAGRVMGKQYWGDTLVWETDDPIVPNYISLEELFHFVWSLPVSTIVTGALNAKELREKIAFVKTMVNLNTEQQKQIIERVSKATKLDEIEYYKKV